MTDWSAPSKVEAEILERWFPTVEEAKVMAEERIYEWNYSSDPHGYCHERPVLIALLNRIRELEDGSRD